MPAFQEERWFHDRHVEHEICSALLAISKFYISGSRVGAHVIKAIRA